MAHSEVEYWLHLLLDRRLLETENVPQVKVV